MYKLEFDVGQLLKLISYLHYMFLQTFCYLLMLDTWVLTFHMWSYYMTVYVQLVLAEKKMNKMPYHYSVVRRWSSQYSHSNIKPHLGQTHMMEIYPVILMFQITLYCFVADLNRSSNIHIHTWRPYLLPVHRHPKAFFLHPLLAYFRPCFTPPRRGGSWPAERCNKEISPKDTHPESVWINMEQTSTKVYMSRSCTGVNESKWE